MTLCITVDGTIAVKATTASPVITLQPQSWTVAAGSNVTVTVAAVGTPAPAYQWFFNSAAAAGEVEPSLTITNFRSTNQGAYSVRVTNTIGSVTSETAMLYLDWPLRFVECCVNSNGLFHTRLVGPAGTNIIIEDCTDIPSQTLLATNTAPRGIIDFTQTMLLPVPLGDFTSTNRFYRAKLVP